MTSDSIISCLARSRARRNRCCPRYTPRGWFECDLAEITPSGFLREYEVKLTRADFEADKLKRGKQQSIGGPTDQYKHDVLKVRAEWAPCQFWFVVPMNLLLAESIPWWAGVIEISRSKSGRLFETETRSAPRLHRRPADPQILQHMESVFYHRYWQLLEKLHRRVAE